MTPQTPPSHLKPLTGLRFLAALLVVLCHGLAFWQPRAVAVPLVPGLGRAIAHAASNVGAAGGGVAVTFFFVLSGFILTYTYCAPGRAIRGGRRAFYVARIARIYPVYLLGLAVAAVPYLCWSGPLPRPPIGASPPVSGLAALTLAQAWFPFLAADWNGPAWSISTEAFFYLLFPLAAAATARLTRRQLFMLLEVVWAIDLAVPLAFLLLHPAGLREVYWLRVVYYNPLARLPTFLIGVAVGRLFMLARAENVSPIHQGPALPTAMRKGPPFPPARLAALALGAAAVILATVPWAFGPLYDAGLTPLLALLVYAMAWNQGRLAAFFSLPAVVLLGEASYALYILHQPLWEWLARLGPRAGTASGLLFFLAYLALLMALSTLAWRAVEQPARQAIRRACAPRGHDASPARELAA